MKERMINVLNWKKPKKWVSVVAVMVCAILLISCATNPKASEPKVDNPQLLEIPGVKWLATPEEVKEALGVTKDQIMNEGVEQEKEDVGNDYDRYLLSVTNLTLYGREVPYVHFQFRRMADDSFALESALVMFAEDVDMGKLREDLTGIYGPGSSEKYSFYMYYSNSKVDHPVESKLESQLAYLAKSAPQMEGIEGNPFQDALDDPNYMVHHWRTENGCSFIPEEVIEYFKYVMDQPWNERETALQDDEVLMEMLDQVPWVHMTVSNRCALTIRRDAQGSDDYPYYTNNYMEINAQWLTQYVYNAETYLDGEE